MFSFQGILSSQNQNEIPKKLGFQRNNINHISLHLSRLNYKSKYAYIFSVMKYESKNILGIYIIGFDNINNRIIAKMQSKAT